MTAEFKTADEIAQERLLELARRQFAPVLKKLPLEPEEREIIEALENEELESADSLKIKKLREILKKYSDDVHKRLKSERKRQRFDQLVEDLENLKLVLKTEKELLEVFKPKAEKRIQVDTGDYVLEFRVKPIEPGDDLSMVNMDERILEQLTAAERVKLRKGMTGMLKNEKEEEEYLELMFKLDQLRMKSLAKETENVAKFLATFLSPPDDKKKALEFWKAQSTALQSVALIKTLEALGLSKDETDKLFRLNKVSGI